MKRIIICTLFYFGSDVFAFLFKILANYSAISSVKTIKSKPLHVICSDQNSAQKKLQYGRQYMLEGICARSALSSPFSYVMHAGRRLAGWISVLFQENGNHKFFLALYGALCKLMNTHYWLTFTSQASHKNYAIMNISLNLLQSVCNKQPNYIIYLPIKCERYLFVMHVHLLLPWCTCIAKLSIS